MNARCRSATSAQGLAASILRYRRPSSVAARILPGIVGCGARAVTAPGSVDPTAVQLPQLASLRRTPPNESPMYAAQGSPGIAARTNGPLADTNGSSCETVSDTRATA